MDINDNIESPLNLQVSFNKLLKQYETLSKSDDEFIVVRANRILKIADSYPELRTGFSDTSVLVKREKEIIC